MRAHLLPLWKR